MRLYRAGRSHAVECAEQRARGWGAHAPRVPAMVPSPSRTWSSFWTFRFGHRFGSFSARVPKRTGEARVLPRASSRNRIPRAREDSAVPDAESLNSACLIECHRIFRPGGVYSNRTSAPSSSRCFFFFFPGSFLRLQSYSCTDWGWPSGWCFILPGCFCSLA